MTSTEYYYYIVTVINQLIQIKFGGIFPKAATFSPFSRHSCKKAFTLTRKEIDNHITRQLKSVFVSFFSSNCHSFDATFKKRNKISKIETFYDGSSCLKCLALGSTRLA